MSQFTRCDGCGTELSRPRSGDRKPERVIHGERTNGMGGGGLPDGEFDWCGRCAAIAFDAVAEYKRVAIDGGTVIP